MLKIVSKKAFIELLGSLLGKYEIIGPKELANKGIFYLPVKNMADLYLGEGFTVEPVKKFFLPPSEWLFKNKYADKEVSTEDLPSQETKRILVAVRPCEARGLELLDKVFDSDYKDRSYIRNREKSIIVGLVCSKPDKTCFCTSLGGSPVDTRGTDALIFAGADSDEVMLEIVTDKAQDIFGSLGKAVNEERQNSYKLEKDKIKDSLKKIKIPEALSDIFESNYWEDVSRPCLSCGICTYLCPTCHCFDLVDEECKRLRCYDGCCFKDFTQETSGENPRPTKKERYRQRVFHKFDFFKRNFGENLCVGCGRCIRYCPVKIDISEIVSNAPLKAKE